MSKIDADRRTARRTPGNHVFSVMVDEQSYPAELTDISIRGFQARVDAVTFDEIRDRIDGVRFGSLPPLPIKLHWGFFDGRFGASFKDELSARAIVEKVVEANGGSPILALY